MTDPSTLPLASDAALDRLRAETEEMLARLRIGGFFYLAGWLLVAAAADEYSRRPGLTIAIALLYAVLAMARLLMRMPTQDESRRLPRLRRVAWAIVLLSNGSWGVVYALTLLRPELAPAADAAILCAVFFATAIAHTFALHLVASILALSLSYLPGLLLIGPAHGGEPVRIALSVYAVYLLAALLRANKEFRRRLQLEEALREQRDQFRRLSETDALTGLCNRGEFATRVVDCFQRARREQRQCALLLLDVDHFKQVNDRWGHAAGDACLIALAERLRQQFAPVTGCSLGRWGGEEFAVLLPGGNALSARIAADSLLEDLRRHPLLPEREAITASIGIGELGPHHASPEVWINDVDRALYRAKDAGRDRVGEIDCSPTVETPPSGGSVTWLPRAPR